MYNYFLRKRITMHMSCRSETITAAKVRKNETMGVPHPPLTRISIAILRTTNHALYGARTPFRPKHHEPQWTDNASIDCYWSNARLL